MTEERSEAGDEFRHRFTILPDTGMTQLHCYPCNVVVWQSYHPSLDVLIEQARAHNLAEHEDG